MKLPNKLIFLFLMFSFLKLNFLQAIELYPFVAHVNSTAISGCCVSFGGSTGMGIVSRWEIDSLGAVELNYFGTGPWSQISLGRPYYLIGQKDRTRDIKDNATTTYISDHKFIISPAVGYTSMVTKTVQYDLPVLLTAYNFNLNTQYLYSINQNFSLTATGQLFYVYSRNAQSWGLSIGVGLGSEF